MNEHCKLLLVEAQSEHCGVVAGILQDVYHDLEARAVIEPLEAYLRAELVALESRMKEKKRELLKKEELARLEEDAKELEDGVKATEGECANEKKRLLVGVGADDEERKCHKPEEGEEAVVMSGSCEQKELDNGEGLKEQAIEEGPQNMDLADDEQGSCLYECSEPSNSLVQCDRCEKWFHSMCAGYECDLSANPE
jgi:hypothetical protein